MLGIIPPASPSTSSGTRAIRRTWPQHASSTSGKTDRWSAKKTGVAEAHESIQNDRCRLIDSRLARPNAGPTGDSSNENYTAERVAGHIGHGPDDARRSTRSGR